MNDRTPADLPKQARLRKRRDYLRVQASGRRHHTEHFVVLTAPGGTTTRVGVTVSTRVGNAVVRNRVKRMLREVLRAAWRRMSPPVDVVVIAKPGAARANHANAATELHRALGLAGA